MTAGYAGRNILVAGAGISGVAAAEVLLRRGARVTVTDRVESARTDALRLLGATVACGLDEPPAGTDLVVTSPGWRPDHPLLRAAASADVEVIGEVELAWRLGQEGGRYPAPWLAVTGTNGKSTTVEMLASILRAGGRRAVAAGNVGRPLVQVVAAPAPYDVLAVELSSFQLHWSSTIAPAAATVLNVAPDHLDWHGSLAAYAGAKGRIFKRTTFAVYNVSDSISIRLCSASPDRAGFTLASPIDGQLGVEGGALVDRAFGHGEFAAVSDVPLPGPHNVANALAAAALAFAHGIAPAAVPAGLRAFAPARHRNERIGSLAGVDYVDDSKATNPHAAAAALAGYSRAVWLAGGLLKGAPVDDLIVAAAPRLVGVVLIGADRAILAQSLARHAPQVPVVEVARTDDGAMAEAVRQAARLARPGCVVLLAPAAASQDMFCDYAARGDAFVAAARELGVG